MRGGGELKRIRGARAGPRGGASSRSHAGGLGGGFGAQKGKKNVAKGREMTPFCFLFLPFDFLFLPSAAANPLILLNGNFRRFRGSALSRG
jgi:hypothetical protein